MAELGGLATGDPRLREIVKELTQVCAGSQAGGVAAPRRLVASRGRIAL